LLYWESMVLERREGREASLFPGAPLLATAALLLLFAQLLAPATRLSATVDEGFHVTSGYEFLRTGHMRLLDEHVPLAKALFAWPLFFVPDLPPPEQANSYAQGDLIGVAQETVLAYQPIDRVIVACRIPVALLTVLLAATVYRWAARCFGPAAGLLALALFAFDPNILAHGSLATTDMGATAFIFWAVAAFSRYLQRPTWQRWGIAVLFLGLAQGAKLTALLLLPLLGALALLTAWLRTEGGRWRAVARQALSYSAMVLTAALVLWALYRFEVRPLPAITHGQLPLPAASHIERWLRLQANIDYGREAFLLGQNRMHGWRLYFPIAFVVKTPLPTLLLLGLAGVQVGRSQVARDRSQAGTCDLRFGTCHLLLFPLLYAVAALFSTIDIGYRHLLPILPFLFVFASRLASPLRRSSALTRALPPLLLLWLAFNALSISPHYLAFFNELAGGADNGYRFLADSNTDWGQGLKDLARYQQENGVRPLKLSLFTFLDPAVYGVDYEPLAPMVGAPPVLPRRFNPAPGWYAISATTLDGVPLPLPSTFDWFRRRQPVARVAHVLFVYDVQPVDADWVAQCAAPVAPLPAAVVEEGFGLPGLRQAVFDCAQSWLWPDGGTTAGWYVQPITSVDSLRWPWRDEEAAWLPLWARRLPLEGLSLSYVQSTPGELPPFAIWEWSAAATLPDWEGEGLVLGETLAFLGHDAPAVARAGASIEVLTAWRVVAVPARPLSLMLHLTAADGAPLAIGDGLGVPIDQWRVGDIIVQRHVLSIPADAPPGSYPLQTGAYWLDDMAHLRGESGAVIPLSSVQIASRP